MNELYDKKRCACCGINGTVRKYTLVFKYSNSAKCCYYCIEQLGGIENARTWLEQHAIFNTKGGFWFEKKENPLLGQYLQSSRILTH